MQVIAKIQKILSRKDLTQTALAELVGIDRSQLTNYLAGRRAPGALPCLLFAALSEEPGDRAFWISESGLTREQMCLVAEAFAIPLPTAMDAGEVALLEWWRHPNKNPMDGSIKSVVETAIGAWQNRGKH